MAEPIGRRRWAIPDGYIPSYGTGPEPEFTSHEAMCFLNVSDEDAHVRVTVYYTDREPVGPYELTVSARRSLHVKFNDLKDPEPIPHDTEYSSLIESDVPIVVQHSRLDSRQAENTLMTTLAFAMEQ